MKTMVSELFNRLDMAKKIALYACSSDLRAFLYINGDEDAVEINSYPALTSYLTERFGRKEAMRMIYAVVDDPELTHIWLFTARYKDASGKEKSFKFNFWHC